MIKSVYVTETTEGYRVAVKLYSGDTLKLTVGESLSVAEALVRESRQILVYRESI